MTFPALSLFLNKPNRLQIDKGSSAATENQSVVHNHALPESWKLETCCSKCGRLYESPSEVGGALLVKHPREQEQHSGVTTANSSNVISAQVRDFSFLCDGRQEKE